MEKTLEKQKAQDQSFDVLFSSFITLCYLYQDGKSLETKFEAANKGQDLGFLEDSVKFAPIIDAIKREDYTGFKVSQISTFRSLESKGYVPYSKVSRMNREHLILTTKRPTESNDDDYSDSSEIQAKKRGRGAKNSKSKVGKKQIVKPKKMNAYDTHWWNHFDQLVEYHRQHKTYNVPLNETVIVDKETMHLGKWLEGEREKVQNYLLCEEYEKYSLLTECMVGGLWTLEPSTANQSSQQSSSSSSSTLRNSAPSPVTRTRSSSANDTSSSRASPAVLPAKPLFNQRKSAPSKAAAINHENIGITPPVAPAEPKNTMFPIRAQHKYGDDRSSSRNSNNSSRAEPKDDEMIVDDPSDDDSTYDEEIQICISKSNFPMGHNGHSDNQIILYEYNKGTGHYIGMGNVRSEKKSSKELKISKLYPKYPLRPFETPFEDRDPANLITIQVQQVLQGKIQLNKGNHFKQ
jgi:hypothetical protein